LKILQEGEKKNNRWKKEKEWRKVRKNEPLLKSSIVADQKRQNITKRTGEEVETTEECPEMEEKGRLFGIEFITYPSHRQTQRRYANGIKNRDKGRGSDE